MYRFNPRSIVAVNSAFYGIHSWWGFSSFFGFQQNINLPLVFSYLLPVQNAVHSPTTCRTWWFQILVWYSEEERIQKISHYNFIGWRNRWEKIAHSEANSEMSKQETFALEQFQKCINGWKNLVKWNNNNNNNSCKI